MLSLERRLRKIEAARGRQGTDAVFLVWASAETEAAPALADLGHGVRSNRLAVGRWPYPDAPAAR